MFSQNTILEDRTLTSVKVGNVFVSVSELQSCLNRFVRNLTNYDEAVTCNELQLIGSTTGIAFCEKRFFVATKHQLKGVEPQNVSIIVPGTEVCMTTAGFSEISSKHSDDDSFDLCLFDFSPQELETRHLNGCFFNLLQETMWNSDDNVVAFVVAGHSFDDQTFDLVDERRVHCVVRSLTCERYEQPNDQCLGRLHLASELEVNPNGFSGGAVFAMCLDNGSVLAKFAGIINRAKSTIIHFIKVNHVLNLLEATLRRKL